MRCSGLLIINRHLPLPTPSSRLSDCSPTSPGEFQRLSLGNLGSRRSHPTRARLCTPLQGSPLLRFPPPARQPRTFPSCFPPPAFPATPGARGPEAQNSSKYSILASSNPTPAEGARVPHLKARMGFSGGQQAVAPVRAQRGAHAAHEHAVLLAVDAERV